MLDYNEKKKVREYLEEVFKDLNLNSKINIAFFLEAIDVTNENVKAIESKLDRVIYNQKTIEQKLDFIIRKIG